MTLRGLLYNTGWLAEDDSMSHHYLARITPWDTLTRRGPLNEGDSTRVTRRGDDSRRTTRRGSLDQARWFDETTLSHNQSIITDIYSQSIVLIIIDTFHFISFSIIILSAFLPANFVTWMIMVLMVFSILFQDHEFNATNCRHKHSCAFSPCVQIYFPSSNVYKRLFIKIERESTNGYGSPENLDNELEALFKRVVSPNLPPNWVKH